MGSITVCPVHIFPPPAELLFCYQPHRQEVMPGQKSIYWTFLLLPHPRNSLEPHTSPPISQYLPFSSPFRIPIDLTLLEICWIIVCSCQLSWIWITPKMLFNPKLLMMFGLLWKEEEGYGQRWTRKLFFQIRKSQMRKSCAHSAISN